MSALIEYRVRAVTRYIVTRYTATENSGGCEIVGEFPNRAVALDVANAFQSQLSILVDETDGEADGPQTEVRPSR